jgi:7-cyano-7-deazaguanine synthase in queuosine biosynthesis
VESFTLRLNAPDAVTAEEAKASFYWLTGGLSSFTTTLDPNLADFGPVPKLNVDLVRIAVAVYAADRSVIRAKGGSNWNQRQIQLKVPVSDAARWRLIANDLESTIGFLTGDHWTIHFNEEQAPDIQASPKPTPSPKRVVLLSGGADSAVGALISRSRLKSNEQHTLLSHYSAPALAPIQRLTAQTVERLIPGPGQQHAPVHLSRNQQRADGTNFPTEQTSRSRSLLFLALGLALASLDSVPLWVPENGFASLNPPLGPERRGSVSTRTTHPAFLTRLIDVLHSVGAHNVIENPFASNTKGEMFKLIADLVGDAAASDFLSATNSCAHTDQRFLGVTTTQQCGVCFGCVVRRASFVASGVNDATSYIAPGGNARLRRWLESKSVEPAMRSFIERGVHQRDLIAMGLPTSYSLSDGINLCQRGVAELAELHL